MKRLTEVINWQRCEKRTQDVRLRDIEGKCLTALIKSFLPGKSRTFLNKN